MTLRRILASSLAAAAVAAAPPARAQSASVFVPVAPCRIADTRLTAAGAVAGGSARPFDVVGLSSHDAQGGSSESCGIPGFSLVLAAGLPAAPQVAAIAVNVVAVDPTTAGNLRVYPGDAPAPPNASTVNFQKLTPAMNVANAVIVPVRQDQPGSALPDQGDVSVFASQTTHVVMDVTGYFLNAPLRVRWNELSPTVGSGSPANDLRANVYAATIGGGGAPGAPNAVLDDYCTVGGGAGNAAGLDDGTFDQPFGTVSGGYFNAAEGAYSTVPGGALNRAAGSSSLAAGSGAEAVHPGAFVWADLQATGDPPALVTFSSAALNEFAVRALGGVRFVTAIDGGGAPTAGVSLATGAGAWSMLSDREAKTDWADVDGTELLARLERMPIRSWRYRSQPDDVRHLGPTAQDFRAAFGVGEDERHISTVDADGVALAAAQELGRRLREKERALEEQGRRLADLERRVAELAVAR